MNLIKAIKNASMLGIAAWAVSCNAPTKTENKEEVKEEVVEKEITYNIDDPSSIIKAVEMASGGWNSLWEQKDVQFTYSYLYADGKHDLSTERYIFDTEESWAKYTQHDINVLPGTGGIVTQYYDGDTTATVMQDSVSIDSPEVLGGAQFLRKANYFWFVMMFKLNNPGAVYEYLGSETVNEIAYDKVRISYDPGVTGKDQNDTYVVYVNPDTKLVDHFYFSLPIMGVNDPAILMKVEYKEISGLMIPVKRDIFMPSPDGFSEEPNLVQTSTEVKFNNGFTSESIQL